MINSRVFSEMSSEDLMILLERGKETLSSEDVERILVLILGGGRPEVGMAQKRRAMELTFAIEAIPTRLALNLLESTAHQHLEQMDGKSFNDPERKEFTEWFFGNNFPRLVDRFPGGRGRFFGDFPR